MKGQWYLIEHGQRLEGGEYWQFVKINGVEYYKVCVKSNNSRLKYRTSNFDYLILTNFQSVFWFWNLRIFFDKIRSLL